MSRRVALLTAAGADDADLPPLVEAFALRGVRAEACRWDAAHDWSAFDAAVIRSTWDYTARLAEFLAAIGRIDQQTRLYNSGSLVRWNVDKAYLIDIAAAGLAVIPTQRFVPQQSLQLSWPIDRDFVLKPAVGAGARGARKFAAGSDPTEIQAHARALWAEGTAVLVQPYLAQVEQRGERALVYVDGRYSHSLTKQALLRHGLAEQRGLYAPEQISAATPSAAELRLAEAVLSWVSERYQRALYARVDLIADDDGAPRLLELELIEPSMFYAHAPPGAALLLVDALLRWLDHNPRPIAVPR